jgi:hypothetical protein
MFVVLSVHGIVDCPPPRGARRGRLGTAGVWRNRGHDAIVTPVRGGARRVAAPNANCVTPDRQWPRPPKGRRARCVAWLAPPQAICGAAQPSPPDGRGSGVPREIAPSAAVDGVPTSPAIPPQGLYEGCAPGGSDGCAARLETIRAAGFRYVLNYSSWYGSREDVLRYADAAAALGLQLIWPLNHPAWRGLGSLGATYPGMSAAYSGGAGFEPISNPAFLARAISLVAGHPATWGFYVGDEVPPSEAASVAALSEAVRWLAPGRPQLYVARPGAALLEPFASLVDVAGVDAYPIGSGDPPVRRVARTARAVAADAGVGTALVLQAFSWSQYRPGSEPSHYPGVRRLRAMRDAAIRNGDPSLILWYSYQDILRSDRPRRRWCELAWAAFSPPPRPSRLGSCA